MKIFFKKKDDGTMLGGGAKLTFSFHFRSVFDKSQVTCTPWCQ